MLKSLTPGSCVIGAVSLDDNHELTCVSLRLTPPVSRIDFWNSGFWQDHREMRHTHSGQLQRIIAQIGGDAGSSALVVAGDFNTTPLDPALDSLRQQFADSFEKTGIGWGATGTNDWPLFRVDQIWTNKQVVPLKSVVRKTIHSDHRMAVCDLLLRD